MNEEENTHGSPADPPAYLGNGALEGNTTTPELKKEKPLAQVLNAFKNSNFFKPVLIGLVLTVFLGGLILFVFKNLGTTGVAGEIVWWGIEHDRNVYAPLISEFEKLNPGVQIKYERQSTTDYRERLQTALSTGTGPDIFEIHNSWPSMFKSHLDKLPSSVMGAEDYKKAFYPVVYSNFSLAGGIVAIPLEYDAVTLFINEEIFAASAKEPPISWDEVRDLSIGLTQKDGRGSTIQAGAALGNTKNVDYWQDTLSLMMIQNKVSPLKPTGPFAEDVLSFYTMFDKKSWDDSLPPSTEAFAKGKLAMYFGPSREASNIVRQNNQLRFRTVNLPQLAKNTPQDPDFSIATYWAQGVFVKSKKTKAAWQFLKFISTEDALKKINANIKKSETFASSYPRPSMNEEMREDVLLGSVIRLAGSASSSPLSGKTFDGETGLNTKLSKLYAGLLEDWKGRGNPGLLVKLNKDLTQVLSEFGILVK